MSDKLSQRQRIEALEKDVRELAAALTATQASHNRLCEVLQAKLAQAPERPTILVP